jgi:hypothetical protein
MTDGAARLVGVAFGSRFVGWCGLGESFADDFRGEAHRDGLDFQRGFIRRMSGRIRFGRLDRKLEVVRIAVNQPGNLDSNEVRLARFWRAATTASSASGRKSVCGATYGPDSAGLRRLANSRNFLSSVKT